MARVAPHSRRAPGRPAEAPTRDGSCASCPSSPSAALPSLLARAGPETSRLLAGEVRRKVAGPVSRSQAATPAPFLGGSRFAVRGQRAGRQAPEPAGLYAPPCCAAAQPPLPSRHPPQAASSGSPYPRVCAPGTQESLQLPPLSRGPAAPRASLDGSRAAVSSSCSSSSSSPSVNSSWLRP